MHIALLHTAEIHVETFDRLFEQAAPKVRVSHLVKENLLSDARLNGVDFVREETLATLHELSGADSVLCTCSTIGPIADAAGALRIDRPLMAAACETGTKPLIAFCLESTKGPTQQLLEETAQEMGVSIDPLYALCDTAWPAFEAGDMELFASSLEFEIRHVVQPDSTAIVLAQASMAVAEPALQDIGLPVLSSPALAVKAAIQRAYANIK